MRTSRKSRETTRKRLLSERRKETDCKHRRWVVYSGSSLMIIHGDVKVSTGVWKPDKRAEVASLRKKGTLKINAKTNNNYALAA